MSRFFTTLTFILFLLFQTTALAEEELDGEQIIIMDEVPKDISEEALPSKEDTGEATEPTQIQEPEATENVEEKGEELAEAQREAQAAEEAELREVGEGEEPEAE